MESRKLFRLVLSLLGLAGLFVLLTAFGKASAAGSVSVVEINYEKSYIKVQLGSGDTALQISDSKQKKWDTVSIEPSGGTVTMDISWIPVTKDYVLALRGDVNTTPVTVTLPMQNKSLKVTYSPAQGLSFTGQGSGTLQWKKKDSIRWKNYPTASGAFDEKIMGMIAKGATLVFRTAPVNGNGSNPGVRASKEATVIVKPKSAAPTITVDGSKLSIDLKKDMEYRYCDEDGNALTGAVWETVDKDETKALLTIAGKALCSNDGSTAGSDVYIQIRKKATDKTQISGITTVKVPGQQPLTEVAKNSITLNYTSSSTVTLTVPVATDKVPYEYCVITDDDIDQGITIDSLKELKWEAISNSKAITLDKSKVPDGSLIYVRKKAIGKSGDDNFALSSPAVKLQAIKFPKELSTLEDELTWLSTIEGVCRPNNTAGYLTFTTYTAIEKPISELKYVKKTASSSVSDKTVSSGIYSFKSEVRPINDTELQSMTAEQKQEYKYVVTTTIMSLEGLDELTSSESYREWYIYYKQGSESNDFIPSTLEKGIAVYVYPSSVIKSLSDEEIAYYESKKPANKLPGDHGDYLKEFSRIYKSNKIYSVNVADWKNSDPNVFSFVIDFGTKYEPDDSQVGGMSTNLREVTKLVYDGLTFTAADTNSAGEKYFTVIYDDTVTTMGTPKRSAIITINTAAMEKNGQIKCDDELKPVDIYLNGNETIKGEIKIKFEKSAVVVSDNTSTSASNQSWMVTGKQGEESTTTTVNGVTTTVTTVNDEGKTIWLKITNPSMDITLDEVTYNGHDILKDILRDGAYFKVVISNKKLNKIIEQTQTRTSYYIYFTFDNGFVLTEGYKLVINPVTE